MSWLRLAFALVFSGLYAAAVVVALRTGDVGLATAMTPIASMVVAYVLGVEFIKALRRKNGNSNGE